MSGHCIHTADWGCGAFEGNIEAIIAIQYLASVVTNTPIVLHGVDNVNKKFKTENIERAKGAVDTLLGQGKTANEILETLFNQHPEWKPGS